MASRRRCRGAGKLSWIIDSTNPPGADSRISGPSGALPPEDSFSVPMPDLTRADWRRCRPPLPLALLTLALLQAQGASAQDAVLDAPITLKRTPQLLETIPKTQRG